MPLNVKDIVTTRGISSAVRVDGDVIGHILLADYDEGHTSGKMEKDFEGIGGINYVFESSEYSYHWWNLTVRDLDTTALMLLDTYADPRFIGPGYRRAKRPEMNGYGWTLRTTPKVNSDGEIYKQQPKLVDAWVEPTAKSQSWPHYWFATNAMGAPTIPEVAEARMNWVGEEGLEDVYYSYTDEGKQRLFEVRSGEEPMECPYCHGLFAPSGFAKHKRACKPTEAEA